MAEIVKILIVDDRPANVIALDALLGNDERVLITAHSGEEALEAVAEEKVDLILLDVQMPGMNGFELAQQLRSKKETSDVPIIFVSAEKIDQASRMKGFEEGAIDYLFKPLDAEITKAKVSVLLELQRRRRQLTEKNSELEKSALLINNSADIMGVLDAHTLIVDEVNPAFTTLLGYPVEKVKGKPLLSFLEKDQAVHVKRIAVGGQQNLSFETRIRSVDDSVKWLEWKVVVKDGKWFVNARDVTEIKALNASLEKTIVRLNGANHELESFSYSVSHDLRAPLRAINGNAQMLEEDFGEVISEDGRKYVKRIRENTMRMDGLINDLLDFSRIGQKEVRRTHLNLAEMVTQIFSQLQEEQPHRAVVVIHPMPGVYADLSLFRIVWVNLISNAIKYSSKTQEPRIEVGGEEMQDGVAYYIADNGVGFDMAYAGKLFGTFQRLHDVREFEGVGIGLAIVHRIILKHGGTIRAEAAPGKGAKFVIKLPFNS